MAFTNNAAFDLLKRAHERSRLAHAYLVSGPAGSGKRELAAQLCALVADDSAAHRDALKNPNVHIIEPESKSRRIVIEQVRGLERELQMRSMFGGRKVGIVFEADRLMPAAANAFLKTLEEPPGNSMLLLTSSNAESMIETILSRCILVPLLPSKSTGPTPAQTQLLEAVRDFFRDEKAGIPQVFALVRRFTGLLAEAREAIGADTEAALEKEQDRYQDTTDGDWLDSREDHYKALTESRYIRQRAALVEVLLQFLADALRQQSGFEQLDHPAFAADTAAVARRLSAQEILRKFAALEDLRENFGRNVHEQLAIEAAFLKAFATHPAAAR
jgi:DNA polymerase-3 subunit delta'